MTELIGALRTGAAPTTLKEVAGDPGLGALVDYLKTVINAYFSATWASIVPGAIAVQNAFPYDIERHQLNPNDLPALYAYRRRGTQEWAAMGVLLIRSELMLRWVMPSPKVVHARLRDGMPHAVRVGIGIAVERVCHQSWVHERDLADSDAFVLSRATATTAVDLIDTDLDGAVGGRGLTSPRYVTITAATAASAYVLTPIVVEGIRGYDYVVDSLTPTSVNGGWQLTGTVLFDRITRVSLPAQTLTTGALEVGHTEDVEANARGSSVLVHTGFGEIRLTNWQQGQLEIRKADGSPVGSYDAAEITLAVTEQSTTDIDALERLQTVDWSIYGATGNEADGVVHIMDRED